MLSFEEFKECALSYNVVPLTTTMLADVYTPVLIYLIMRPGSKASFLFESVEPNERTGRYSFIGIEPRAILKAKGESVELHQDNTTEILDGYVFDVLAQQLQRYRIAPGSVTDGFGAGFAGYFGYDCVKDIEHIPLPSQQEQDAPEALLGLFGIIISYDHRLQRITIVNNVFIDQSAPLQSQYDEGKKKVDAIRLRLRNTVAPAHSFQCQIAEAECMKNHEWFCCNVEEAKKHIYDGDIFQVVLSRRVDVAFTGDPFPVYRALRVVNPSPYLFYLDFGETKLIGSSPETLVRAKRGVAEVFPIAGTRRRGSSPEEDKFLAKELLNDPKESAEHVMLVDLGRNDLGRICEYGSVEVPVFKRVELYSHVMHLVSEVKGKIKSGISAIDVLRSCFPAGTVTGAPKVRAMEIISALEGKRRGVYAGAVGYLGLDDTLDTCIAIRTIVAHRDRLSIQSGAGIVADSVAENEFQETVNKVQALFTAIEYASNGLSELTNEGAK